MSGKKLRVAGYCRTSSEGQRDNSSIPNQKEAIERYATAMGWGLVGWYVDEAKSGSRIEGREQFQQMMRDAAVGQFDVVVVFDVTRFGRDGMVILDSARTLQTVFGVRLVDTRGGFDTAGSTMSNYVHAGLAEEEKRNFLRRTKGGKIRYARETGAPIGPKRPFGRVWVRTGKKAGEGRWEVDPEKKAVVEDVARRYLAGESLVPLAAEYSINQTYLHVILKERCGPVWVQRIRCKELGIDEAVQTAVPRLLPEEVIQAIRERSEANKTYAHNPLKHKYLLARVVFCATCGYALCGETNKHGTSYYRHPNRKRVKVPCGTVWHVRADDLEDAVLRHLFEMFGNPLAIQKAVEAATPDTAKQDEARGRLAAVARELEKVKEARGRLVRQVAKGTFRDEDVEEEMGKLAAREAKFQAESARLLATLRDAPDPEVVRGRAENLADFGRRLASRYELMSWDEKRGLVQLVFGGKLRDGRRMGVYLTQITRGKKGTRGQFNYVIHGHLVDTAGFLPTPDPETWAFAAPAPTLGTNSATSSPPTARWT